jgi:hypothetical protein
VNGGCRRNLRTGSREQAGVVYRYVLGFLQASPVLRQEIESVTQSEIRLRGNVVLSTRASDPEAARAEWDAEFRSDIAALLDDQTMEAAIDHGRPLELPPLDGYTFYRAFCDASGGVGADSYTLAVGHKEGAHFVIDLVRGTGGKFDPDIVTQEYAALLREYRAFQVTGDSYVRTVGSRRLAQGRHRLFQV